MWIINTLFIQICLLVGGGAKQKQIYLKLETFSQVNGDTYYFKCGTGDEYFSRYYVKDRVQYITHYGFECTNPRYFL